TPLASRSIAGRKLSDAFAAGSCKTADSRTGSSVQSERGRKRSSEGRDTPPLCQPHRGWALFLRSRLPEPAAPQGGYPGCKFVLTKHSRTACLSTLRRSRSLGAIVGRWSYATPC